MILYTYWRSSCSWRVRIALAHKNIPHELRVVNLLRDGGAQHLPDYQQKNPMEQVPTLEWQENGKIQRLTQSLAILEYLEEQFPHPPLLPRDPFLRAKARQFAEIINAGIQPIHNLSVSQRIEKEFGGTAAAWNAPWIVRGLTALEKDVAQTAGTFCVGNELSIADCCLVPQLYAARRFGVDPAQYPTLLRIESACATLPAFQTAHAEAQSDAVL